MDSWRDKVQYLVVRTTCVGDTGGGGVHWLFGSDKGGGVIGMFGGVGLQW